MKRKLEVNGKPKNPNELNYIKAKKKPIEVKACRIFAPFKVHTLEGVMEGKTGDFLVIGINGEMYPVNYQIFIKTYDILRKTGIKV